MDANLLLQLLNEQKLHIIIIRWMKLNLQEQRALEDFQNNYLFLYQRLRKETISQAAQRGLQRTKELSMKEPISHVSHLIERLPKSKAFDEYFEEFMVIITAANQYLMNNKEYNDEVLRKLLQVLGWYARGANASD